MYIVLEYLLLENLIINYLILYLTTLIIRIEVNIKRLLIGAFIASFYSLVFFIPSLFILRSMLAKVIISFILVRISFKYINLKLYLREVIGFYIVSFIFAGATLGIFYSSSNNIFSNPINIFNGFPVKYLFIGILISIVIGKIIFKFYNLKLIRENYLADVILNYKGKSILIKALLDTGNSLIDPFTNKKVFVVEYSRLRSILPYGIKDLIEANENYDYSLTEKLLDELQSEIRLTIIPFKSVGKNGVIFGFRPDSVIINYMDKTNEREDLLIGIYTGLLSKDMGYSGLLHYELIYGGVENEFVKV